MNVFHTSRITNTPIDTPIDVNMVPFQLAATKVHTPRFRVVVPALPFHEEFVIYFLHLTRTFDVHRPFDGWRRRPQLRQNRAKGKPKKGWKDTS